MSTAMVIIVNVQELITIQHRSNTVHMMHKFKVYTVRQQVAKVLYQVMYRDCSENCPLQYVICAAMIQNT